VITNLIKASIPNRNFAELPCSFQAVLITTIVNFETSIIKRAWIYGGSSTQNVLSSPNSICLSNLPILTYSVTEKLAKTKDVPLWEISQEQFLNLLP
jgi:hypothetical protein